MPQEPERQSPRESSPQRQVGPYQLIHLLGRGAMGSVYRARDPRTKRDVALKLPIASENNARRMERMRREGQATAALDHPHVVKIHELGVDRGIPFLAYELVEGARALDQVVADLPIRRRVELVRDAARAIGHAHARGILHRDIKPENILIDRAGAVKVADFGLAQVVGLEALTQTGALVGTPSAMAPEQINGQREQFGPPTDVWALGVVLYAALTGEYPFVAESLIALASEINRATPRPLKKLVPGIAPELEQVCRRALAKAPAERYPSGDALADALDECLALDELTGTRPRRWLFTAAAVGLLLVLTAAGLALSRSRREEPAHEEAEPEAPSEIGLTHAQLRAAERDLRLLRSERSPRKREANARRWLSTFARHPSADEVRALRDRSQLEFPLLRYEIETYVYAARWIGERVLTCEQTRVRLWSADGATRTWPVSFNPQHVAIPHDSAWALAWGDSQFLWLDPDASEPRFKGVVEGIGHQPVYALAHHPHEPSVAVALATEVVLLDLSETPRVERRLARGSEAHPIISLAWSPDGAQLLVGRSHQGTAPTAGTGVERWSVEANERLAFYPLYSRARGLAWDPQGRHFAISTSSGDVLLSAGDGEPLHRFIGQGGSPGKLLGEGSAHGGPTGHLDFSPGGSLLVSGGNRRSDPREPWIGEVHAWDVRARTPHEPSELPALFAPQQRLGPSAGLEIRHDGRRILWASSRGIQVWALPAGRSP